jgi:hypothetical protein
MRLEIENIPYEHNSQQLEIGGLYEALPNEKVFTTGGTKCYGRTYTYKAYENDDDVVAKATEDFAEGLGYAIAGLLAPHFDGFVPSEGQEPMTVHLPSAYSAVETYPEGYLPAEERKVFTTKERDLTIDPARVKLKVLVPPTLMRLARIAEQHRFMIVVYLQVEVTEA